MDPHLKAYVCIHVYHAKHINLAIDAGVKCIEHGFLMDEKPCAAWSRKMLCCRHPTLMVPAH